MLKLTAGSQLEDEDELGWRLEDLPDVDDARAGLGHLEHERFVHDLVAHVRGTPALADVLGREVPAGLAVHAATHRRELAPCEGPRLDVVVVSDVVGPHCHFDRSRGLAEEALRDGDALLHLSHRTPLQPRSWKQEEKKKQTLGRRL